MTVTVVTIFVIVYVGMILGGLPRRHARAGIPVTLATLAIVGGWFAAAG